MTFAWGFVVYFFLPDGPHNAKMLTEYERMVAVWRISRNQTGLKHPKIVPSQIREALLDPKQWLLYLMAICYGILNGGVANFLAAIVKGFGYSPLRTSLLQTPVGAFELVMVIAFGYLSKVPNMLGATIFCKYYYLLSKAAKSLADCNTSILHPRTCGTDWNHDDQH